MQIHDVLNGALLLIGKQLQAAESTGREEDVAVWRYLSDIWIFTIITGQVYVFEDYLTGLDPGRTPYVSTALNARTDAMSRQGVALLFRTLDDLTDPIRKQYILVLIDLLNFIAASGQHEAFENYLEDRHSLPPPVIAFFDTREEADAWLHNHPELPSYGHVLIGDEYYGIWYSREDSVRELLRNHVMELFLDDYTSKPRPPAAASFNTREEAMEWLASHPASPMTLVAIAGEDHHAVFHKKFNRHTLHSISRLREEREKQKAEMEQQEDEEAEPSED
ncbi:hypothetical protein [Archangium sp.]|uniref:hypothetical protein n=1 Tax=Archangium sp. TaxID=1872627 RepID=UPI00286D45A3|nr:hypothetical protein [Archangium sp.]